MTSPLSFRMVTLFSGWLLIPSGAIAQITPDATLGSERSQVTINGLGEGFDRIEGGAIRGSNLFHSFQEFNITENRGAMFSPSSDITTIFARITGSTASRLDGTLGVLGKANLFFLNPNGILFGANARLDLGGSLVATTANRVQFADGTEFSTIAPASTPPLLTQSAPIGLSLHTPGPIEVQGYGHQLLSSGDTAPLVRGWSEGLGVASGQTIALIGGNLDLNNGVILAPEGHIELGSVTSGTVGFNSNLSTFTYSPTATLGDIRFTQRAIADASGFGGGSITVQGRTIQMSDASAILIQNWGELDAGPITLRASERINLKGSNDPLAIVGIKSQNLAQGKSSAITIQTPQLKMADFSEVASQIFGSGNGQDVKIQADLIELENNASLKTQTGQAGNAADVEDNSSLSTQLGQAGNAGNLIVNTQRLSGRNGGYVSSISSGDGDSGMVIVNASDLIELSGIGQLVPSAIAASTYGHGDAGVIFIKTPRLWLHEGGSISSSSYGAGRSGYIDIEASESITVQGNSSGAQPISSIRAASLVAPPFIRQVAAPAFGPATNPSATESSLPTGDSGDIYLETPLLIINHSATVTVSNVGSGKSGRIQINADRIQLDHQGGIISDTITGEGGNIDIVADTLVMQHGSRISATSKGNGNGGNITLDVGAIAQLQNSDITANANLGNGGNIQIQSFGIFASPDSQITATSKFGLNGTVDIATLTFADEDPLAQQTAALLKTDQVIAGSCFAKRNQASDRFVISGTGGIARSPLDPTQSVGYSTSGLHDIQTSQASSTSAIAPKSSPASFQEATALITTPDGRLLLVADNLDLAPPVVCQ